MSVGLSGAGNRRIRRFPRLLRAHLRDACRKPSHATVSCRPARRSWAARLKHAVTPGSIFRQDVRMRTRRLDPFAHAAGCDDVIRSLPYFFGREEGVAACAQAVRQQPGWVAEHDGVIAGFLTLRRHAPESAEVTWMAVHQDHRRAGIGRVLIERAVADLADQGVVFLLSLLSAPPVPSQASLTAMRERDSSTDRWGSSRSANCGSRVGPTRLSCCCGSSRQRRCADIGRTERAGVGQHQRPHHEGLPLRHPSASCVCEGKES